MLGAVAFCVVLFLVWPSSYCRSADARYGIRVPVCPDGLVRQRASIEGVALRRGGEGIVRLRALAVYTTGEMDSVLEAPIPRLEGKLSLLRVGAPKERILEPRTVEEKPRPGWTVRDDVAEAKVALPADLADGDYLLRATVATKVGQSTVELPLPLYAPARIHVLTDRPLYEPGHRVQFRALALRARDLTPIDHRPGRFRVTDPEGNVLLEELAPAGEWGVVAGSFLLDRGAPQGSWSVSWRSGNDEGTARFTVEPFVLPRFRVSAEADRPFYAVGDRPRVTGAVVYSSGAPVGGASVELRWQIDGAWPPPNGWLERTLPRRAVTDAAGKFALELPAIPADLQGRATLSATVAATDAAGDRVEGALSVLLAEDAIQVSAITPFEGGIVSGFNNRIYLRVTTADGRPLPADAKIKVRKAWLAAEAEGEEAELDAEGVARLQLDPGPPVNVVIPPPPLRKAAATKSKVSYAGAHDLVSDEDAGLDDRVELDRWLALVEPCAKWIEEAGEEAKVAIRVSEAGAILSGAAQGELARCVLARIQKRRLPKGKARLYALTFSFPEPELPRLKVEIATATGDEAPEKLSALVESAARGVRDCLPRRASGALPAVLVWQLQAGSTKPTFSWLKAAAEGEEKIPATVLPCILGGLGKAKLEEAAESAAMGLVRYTLEAPGGEGDREEAPQPTIMRGYELLISAEAGGKPIGKTKLRLKPGEIPALTVRADPVVVDSGEKVTLQLLRGPTFSGELPKKIAVEHHGDTKILELPKGSKTVDYVIPKDRRGWFRFSAATYHQVQAALVFVRSGAQLAVKVTPEQPRYAPGARARLLLRTRVGDRGTKAAVGLFGVDESLAQLAPLPGPDALRALLPEIGMKERAFGVLDGQALTLGRIRGRYAAEATVLRVATVPRPAELDAAVNATASTVFDPNTEVTDRFYTVLAELHRRARGWEKAAPAREQMTPTRMAELWTQALAACSKRGEKVTDAFGRTLRLHRLPGDLLALTDPRQVVAIGTRLPEDVENWAEWVARRKP